MKSIPKVTIITVVFNAEAHLEQTIRSVIEQDYPSIEYIIIDGGSTDGTLDIINRYQDRINYWVSETDDGIYDAMNKGIRKATGNVIGLINADDWYAPGSISRAMNIMQETGAEVVHGAMLIFREGRETMVKRGPKKLDNFAKGMLLNHPTVFARASLYRRFGLFDTAYRIAADWEILLRWWLNDISFYVDDEVIANFRMGGISSRRLRESFEEKHTIRRKHHMYTLLDRHYLYDRMKFLIPSDILLNRSIDKLQKMEPSC